MDIKTGKFKVPHQKEKEIKLEDFATGQHRHKPDDNEINKTTDANIEEMQQLQYNLYAANKQSILIVFQGMDSSGKDSAIRHIMSGLNPQGALVHSFKAPSYLEMQHDYLWRHYIKLPENGQIVIFNRSYYENVLISRVHPQLVLAEKVNKIVDLKDVDKKFWATRYRQINNFEETLTENGTTILKFFLHLSKDEQRKRFLERIEKRDKHWKFSNADIAEREHWDEYQKSYEKMLNHTSNKFAPWYVIPADDKWFTHMLISKIVTEHLTEMNPVLPPVTKEEQDLMNLAKEKLQNER
ncbi:MAG: polyphosphate kinase 2 family protein [Taibaiella sp.]|nr:polyphosphate kinase 2 family protein [Taibaiella sp.]